MDDGDVEVVQSMRGEICDHVVVENRGQGRRPEELRDRDMTMAERRDAPVNQCLHLIEESRLVQQRNRQEQREKEK